LSDATDNALPDFTNPDSAAVAANLLTPTAGGDATSPNPGAAAPSGDTSPSASVLSNMTSALARLWRAYGDGAHLTPQAEQAMNEINASGGFGAITPDQANAIVQKFVGDDGAGVPTNGSELLNKLTTLPSFPSFPVPPFNPPFKIPWLKIEIACGVILGVAVLAVVGYTVRAFR
jgi:hypothetical protein